MGTSAAQAALAAAVDEGLNARRPAWDGYIASTLAAGLYQWPGEILQGNQTVFFTRRPSKTFPIPLAPESMDFGYSLAGC
jgi:hypothetical protein